MTEYSNILAALNGPKLTPQQQTENLDAFKRLQDQGVSIPDLLKRLDDLEQKVESLAGKPGPVDAELFAMMAESVKDDEAVASARRRMQAEKTRAISELCMTDQGYKAAFEAYRQAVTAAYMERKGRGYIRRCAILRAEAPFHASPEASLTLRLRPSVIANRESIL